MKGESRALDIGRFNHRFFTYIASFGAFTEASYAAPQAAKNTFGHLAYVMEGIKDLSGIRPFSLTVDSDDHRLEGPFVYGSVSNTTSIGGVIKLPSPLVDLGDGRLEVLLVRPPQNPTELGRILQCLQKKRYEWRTGIPVSDFLSGYSLPRGFSLVSGRGTGRRAATVWKSVVCITLLRYWSPKKRGMPEPHFSSSSLTSSPEKPNYVP